MERYLPVEWVSENIIQDAFNSGQYWERVKAGELNSVVEKDRHPNPPPSGEPLCTRSQYVVYRTLISGEFVAGVHQYLREDRTLGASGKPDPKRLVFEGRILAVRSKP